MISFALTSDTNDMYLDANGNFALFVTQLEAIGQLVTCYLQTFLGEVPTNRSLGVDYFGIVFNEFLTQQSKINELVRVILTVPGVLSIENFTVSPNPSAGEIGYDFTIVTDAGSIQFQDLVNNGDS